MFTIGSVLLEESRGVILRLDLFDSGGSLCKWSKLIAVGRVCKLFAIWLFERFIVEVGHVRHALLDGHVMLSVLGFL